MIGTLMLIVGIVRTILGIFLLSGNPYAKSGLEQSLPPGTTSPDSLFWWIGLSFLIVGLLGLLMSYGMFTLKGWAWVWTIVVASFNLVGVFVSYFSGHLRGIDAFLSIAIFGLVVYYLSTTPVKRAFGMVHHR
ncbi:MAG TPA: hypothetical protein IGR64_13535 [Leptolyngbyaceae cyanobacterium M65_K2018_010]|nr:hypothetical protein [Leptolyngbyaceae cyanobacterium M65_K2018_010]